jgi:hypothetical protein
MKFWKIPVLCFLLVPLVVDAETISWTWAPMWADGTTVSATDQAKMTAYLRIWKAGSPGAKTYFGEKRNGATSWTDNIMVRANEWAVTNAVPGWVPLKAWDNVDVTLSAAFRSPTDNVERDSAESPPYRWMIPGPDAFGVIYANPVSIVRGNCTALNWTTSNAISASINQGIGAVALSGTRQVCPTVDTSYTITATNPGGSKASVPASVMVTVPAQPGCNPPTGITITK